MLSEIENLSPDSRVWIYQCDRKLKEDEVKSIRNKVHDFIKLWTAHNHQLMAFGEVYYGYFIILMADETHTAASGCSIDSSVHFIKELESSFGISLMNRMNIAFKENEQVFVVEKNIFETMVREGRINDITIVFNNTVSTKSEMEKKWEITFGQSWHKKILGN